jgi:hypothetical protein
LNKKNEIKYWGTKLKKTNKKKDKKTTIKIMSIIFDIKIKQNKIKLNENVWN